VKKSRGSSPKFCKFTHCHVQNIASVSLYDYFINNIKTILTKQLCLNYKKKQQTSTVATREAESIAKISPALKEGCPH